MWPKYQLVGRSISRIQMKQTPEESDDRGPDSFWEWHVREAKLPKFELCEILW
jgi:hypothetical protein